MNESSAGATGHKNRCCQKPPEVHEPVEPREIRIREVYPEYPDNDKQFANRTVLQATVAPRKILPRFYLCPRVAS